MSDELQRLRAFIDRLSAERSAPVDVGAPPDIPEPDYNANRLQWVPTAAPKVELPMPIHELRLALPRAVRQYVLSDSDKIFLVHAQAGSGKTYSGVQAAQDIARDGKRVLWVSQRHDMFTELSAFPHFDGSLWYHWLPMHTADPENQNDLMPTTCLYEDAQRSWAHRGYKSFNLCSQLCALNGYMAQCVYRNQAKRKEPIVFAMHQHLVHGLSVADFDVVIIDELPLGAFVRDRVIPTDKIAIADGGSAIRELTVLLAEISQRCKDNGPPVVSGKELFDMIGPVLATAYDEVQINPDAVPLTPVVKSADGVKEVPYWYILDLLEKALVEFRAWSSGLDDWVSRLSVTRGGLHILSKAEPWVNLPTKIVVLDATSPSDLYRIMLGREVESFDPVVKRQGRLFQVTGRLNGVSTLGTSDKPSPQAMDALLAAKAIASRYEGRVGVICPKSIRGLFDRNFGEENVQHYHALRGSNDLEGVECLIVVGSPAPPANEIVRMASALEPDRVTPYGQRDENGKLMPYFYQELRPLVITGERWRKSGMMTPHRMSTGFWSEPVLQVLYETLRESELVQAIHRARINAREADVWVLTSTPIPEPLDDVWDEPPLGPPEIGWKAWLKIEQMLRSKQPDDAVTDDDLADATGGSVDYIRNKRWLAAIASYDNTWLVDKIKLGPGRPRNAIRKE